MQWKEARKSKQCLGKRGRMFSNNKTASNANYIDIYFTSPRFPQYIRSMQVLMFLTEFVCAAWFSGQRYSLRYACINSLSLLEEGKERCQAVALSPKR